MGYSMSLPDIHFAEKDAAVIESELNAKFTELSGRTLAAADPINIIFKVFTAQIAVMRNNIDKAGRMNLLSTTQDEYLDEFAQDFKLERKKAISASTTIRFTLTEIQLKDIIIKKDTKVTAGDNIYFAVKQDTKIIAGNRYVDVICYCTTPGTVGNNYKAGSINQQFQTQQFISGVSNLDISSGGLDKESDEQFKERRLLAPEALSTAGPDDAYKYWTKDAVSDVIDVQITSPSPAEVIIYPLMKDGRFPTPTELELILQNCKPEGRRPLTDKVSTCEPTAVEYKVNLRYWLSSKVSVDVEQMQANINQAVQSFIYYTKTGLGRAINPDILHNLVMNAGARRLEILEPTLQNLQIFEVGNNTSCNVEYQGIEVDN